MLRNSKFLFSTFYYIAHINKKAFYSVNRYKIPVNLFKNSINFIYKHNIKKDTSFFNEEYGIVYEIESDNRHNFLVKSVKSINVFNGKLTRPLPVQLKSYDNLILLRSKLNGKDLYIKNNIPTKLKEAKVKPESLIKNINFVEDGFYRGFTPKPDNYVFECVSIQNKNIVTNIIKPDFTKFGLSDFLMTR